MNSRKGIKSFSTQTEGLKYFTLLIISAANRGWFETEEVKTLFRREVEKWDASTDDCVGQFWGLVCLPILSFFKGVVEGGDDFMNCDFSFEITGWKKSRYIEGSLTWHSQGTRDRFVHLVFLSVGVAFLYYNLGNSFDRDLRQYVPRQKSSFLGLPSEGDTNLSVLSHEGFAKLAKEAINA